MTQQKKAEAPLQQLLHPPPCRVRQGAPGLRVSGPPLASLDSWRLGKDHDGLTYRRRKTLPGAPPFPWPHLPTGRDLGGRGTSPPFPGQREESGYSGRSRSRPSPGVSCPQEGWVLACPLLATSQAGSRTACSPLMGLCGKFPARPGTSAQPFDLT